MRRFRLRLSYNGTSQKLRKLLDRGACGAKLSFITDIWSLDNGAAGQLRTRAERGLLIFMVTVPRVQQRIGAVETAGCAGVSAVRRPYPVEGRTHRARPMSSSA